MSFYTVRRTFGELLITLGCLLLLFASWQLWWTDVESNAKADTSVENFYNAVNEPRPQPQKTDARGMPEALDQDGVFAVIRIPRFGSEWVKPVVQDTGWLSLTRGLGHYEETVGPGKVGNFSLAGHRTTYGRPLHDIEQVQDGDIIIVETKDVLYAYAVSSHEIVLPTDVGVIAAVPGDPSANATKKMITLTTCHPKFSAAQRYIVHGTLVAEATRKKGLPEKYFTVPAPKE